MARSLCDKRLLKNQWTLLYYEREAKKSSEGCEHELSTIKTFFKNDFRPVWNDKINLNGDHWSITFSNNFNQNVLNHISLDLLLLLFQERLECTNVIRRVVFN